MGNPPVQSQNSNSEKTPISKESPHTGGTPNTAIIFGVLISVAIGILIIIFRHFKKDKKSDDAPKTGMSHSPEANAEDTTPQPEPEQQRIDPDTATHEELTSRFGSQ